MNGKGDAENKTEAECQSDGANGENGGAAVASAGEPTRRNFNQSKPRASDTPVRQRAITN
jgi:hypothetical protein